MRCLRSSISSSDDCGWRALLAVGGGLGVDGGLEGLSGLLTLGGSLGGDDEGAVLTSVDADGLQDVLSICAPSQT